MSITNAATILTERAREILHASPPASASQKPDTAAVLCVIVTFSDFDHCCTDGVLTELDFLKQSYSDVPFIYEPKYSDTQRVDKAIAYGVNGTSVTMNSIFEYRYVPHALYRTPINEFTLCPATSNHYLHRIESPATINSIIRRVSSESSMDQVIGLFIAGLFEQSKLLASLPMKLGARCIHTEPADTTYDYCVEESVANANANANDDLYDVADEELHEYEKLYGSGEPEPEDWIRVTDEAEHAKIPISFDEIIDFIKWLCRDGLLPHQLYRFLRTTTGSNVIEVLELKVFPGLARADIVSKIASTIFPGEECIDAVDAIVSLYSGKNFSELTSKYGIFDYLDVHTYMIVGKTACGHVDSYLEKALPKLMIALMKSPDSAEFEATFTIQNIPSGLDYMQLMRECFVAMGTNLIVSFVMRIMSVQTPGTVECIMCEQLIKSIPC